MAADEFTIEQKIDALRASLEAWEELSERSDGRTGGCFGPQGWAGRALRELLAELQLIRDSRGSDPAARVSASPSLAIIGRPSRADIQWAMRAMQLLGDMSERTSRRILEVLIGPFDMGDDDGGQAEP